MKTRSVPCVWKLSSWTIYHSSPAFADTKSVDFVGTVSELTRMDSALHVGSRSRKTQPISSLCLSMRCNRRRRKNVEPKSSVSLRTENICRMSECCRKTLSSLWGFQRDWPVRSSSRNTSVLASSERSTRLSSIRVRHMLDRKGRAQAPMLPTFVEKTRCEQFRMSTTYGSMEGL